MRDLQKYDDYQPVRRTNRKSGATGDSYIMGSISRLVFLVMLLFAVGYAIWYSHQPVNQIVTDGAIEKIETERII